MVNILAVAGSSQESRDFSRERFNEEIKEMFKIKRLEVYEISDLRNIYDQIWNYAYEAGFDEGEYEAKNR